MLTAGSGACCLRQAARMGIWRSFTPWTPPSSSVDLDWLEKKPAAVFLPKITKASWRIWTRTNCWICVAAPTRKSTRSPGVFMFPMPACATTMTQIRPCQVHVGRLREKITNFHPTRWCFHVWKLNLAARRSPCQNLLRPNKADLARY